MPTLPVAPVTTILLPASLLTFGSSRAYSFCGGHRVPGRGRPYACERAYEKAPTGRGIPVGAVLGWARMAVASRRKAPQGFSRTIVPVGKR
ncbi:hypothetical protein SSP24_02800 [Streptomyces spinoverrucosus]|uniref:Uncharacterized protein n=1 Tax=Streptomyces spinoverrucosus TaxID=284043 RepID=A0A4Y3V855_9ACTN|nr:hypothetical protein SSP24_02800 [Streptomyces spinoverrucosus]GHB41699.1 hypothetical protein GCM10010397_09800 [Streptomyces spinoverrucosus]